MTQTIEERIEEQYQEQGIGNEFKIEDEELLNDWFAGHGTIADREYVLYEDSVFTRWFGDDDTAVYERQSDGSWRQY